MLQWVIYALSALSLLIRSSGCLYQSAHFMGEYKHGKERREKPTKKALMKEIESATQWAFDLVSLNRTNIANIKAIAELLKA